MLRLGVLVSGGGTNLQAIMDAIERGDIPDTKISVVVSSKEGAKALTRAKKVKIPTEVVNKEHYGDVDAFDAALVRTLQTYSVDLVIMAGFMSILGPLFVRNFEGRIMNIHPALIPSFCGEGFYGIKVHKKVLKSGVKVTGATVHFVTEEVDAGPIILQKPVMVQPFDTPEMLQQRVMEHAEWQIYPQAIKLYAEGRLQVEGNIVKIKQQ